MMALHANIWHDAPMTDRLHCYPDVDALVQAAVADFLALVDACGGECHIALAGGSTPRRFHAALAEAGAGRDWSAVHFWFGDERAVPHDHPQSNYRMARETLFEPLSLPAQNIHPVPVPGTILPVTLDAAARQYEAELARLPKGPGGFPRFDLILLGMGEDGHTASLFPGNPALQEQRRAVVAVKGPKAPPWRITLTLPVINAARRVWLMVTGEGKAPAMRRVRERLDPPLPVQRVQPAGGADWYVDAAALGGRCP